MTSGGPPPLSAVKRSLSLPVRRDFWVERLAREIFFYTIVLPTFAAIPYGVAGAYKELKNSPASDNVENPEFHPRLTATLTGFVNGYIHGFVTSSNILGATTLVRHGHKRESLAVDLLGTAGMAPLLLAIPGALVKASNNFRDYKGSARSIRGSLNDSLKVLRDGLVEGYKSRWKHSVMVMAGFVLLGKQIAWAEDQLTGTVTTLMDLGA